MDCQEQVGGQGAELVSSASGTNTPSRLRRTPPAQKAEGERLFFSLIALAMGEYLEEGG